MLIPSLGTTARVWDPVVEVLTAHPGVEVLLFDLPGHGSAPPRTDAAIELLADELSDHVESARNSDHVVLAGISMGGAIAVEAARRGRMPLAGVASFNSALRFGTAEVWTSIIERVRRAGTPAFDPEATRRGWFTEDFAAGRGSAAVDEVLRELAEVDVDGYIACCSALRTYKCEMRPNDIVVPGIAVGGAADTATPPALMRALADSVPGFRYAELPGAHLAALECAPAAAQLLVELIAPLTERIPPGADRHQPALEEETR